jgi:hypothetical protein
LGTFLAIDSYDASDIASISAYLEANVYPYLQSKGLVMQPFFGPLARPEYVALAASAAAVTLLTGGGHGTYDSFLGFHSQPVFAVGAYTAAEVSGKIAHFLSCENGKQLGPDFVTKGCLAYVGYDENFVFDPTDADRFFNCDSEFLRGLADGLAVGEAVERAKNLFAQTIAELTSQGLTDAANLLTYDLSHLRSPLDGAQWGSADVKLT